MPTYQNKPCEGTCERLGQRCQRATHYTEQAERFSAKPKQFTSTFKYNTPAEVTWYFWGLGVPEKKEKSVCAAMAACSPELVDEAGQVWPYWLKEFPCYLDCPITICGYCGKQHEKDLIREGYCLYDAHVEKPKPTKSTTYYAKTWQQIQQEAKDKKYAEKLADEQAVKTKKEVDEKTIEETLALLSPETVEQMKDYIKDYNGDSKVLHEVKERLAATDEEE